MIFKPAVTAGVLTVVALLFFGSRLSQSASPLRPAEVALARQAYSIAQTGRDLDGRLLPLYVHSENEIWFPPLPAYAAVLATAIVPNSPAAVRWPSVVFGVITLLLVYRIALTLFHSRATALLAAILLMLSPVHYIYSRLAVDGVFDVPFVLGSMLAVLCYLESRRRALLWAAGLWLGIGFYSSTTAPIMMPVYLAVAALVIWLSGQRRPAIYLQLALGFALPLLCLVPWFVMYPQSYGDTVGRWGIHAAHVRNPIDGLRAMVNWGSLTNRASIHWEFLNPAFLFFPPDESSVGGTTASGPMVFAVLLLLPFGVVRICQTCSTAVRSLILAGFLVAPLAAATFGENHAIGRALIMISFAVIVAAFGVEHLWSSPRPMSRALAVLALILVPLQFAFFHAAYLGSKVP